MKRTHLIFTLLWFCILFYHYYPFFLLLLLPVFTCSMAQPIYKIKRLSANNGNKQAKLQQQNGESKWI